MTETEIMQEIEDQNMRLAKSNEHNTELENEEAVFVLTETQFFQCIKDVFAMMCEDSKELAAVIKKMKLGEKGE